MNASALTRILVVEDDNAVALALRARLAHEGYEVFVANDAVSALTVAKESRPDVALLDIHIPSGSGFDVARQLNQTACNVAKIFITSSQVEGLREEALQVGAKGFVEKPFTAAQLKQAIDTALSQPNA